MSLICSTYSTFLWGCFGGDEVGGVLVGVGDKLRMRFLLLTSTPYLFAFLSKGCLPLEKVCQEKSTHISGKRWWWKARWGCGWEDRKRESTDDDCDCDASYSSSTSLLTLFFLSLFSCPPVETAGPLMICKLTHFQTFLRGRH